MNDTMPILGPISGIDLGRYVDEVRRELADLPDEVREELTEGLTADLAELVEERGSGALPRPEEYAAELRASAGLPPATRRPLLAPDWWRPAWEVAVAALPAWWVARAWIWVMLLHVALWGQTPDAYDVAWLPTSSWGLGVLLWAVAAVISIQIGRGKLWPGGQRSTAALVAVVVMNAVTLAGTYVVWDQVNRVLDDTAQSWYSPDTNPAVITYQEQQSCSLKVFTADGKRLHNVTIEDQSGRLLPQRNRSC
jgi:hypothetical protein